MTDKLCTQCGAELNPVQVLLGPVCGKCCRENHRRLSEPHQVTDPKDQDPEALAEWLRVRTTPKEEL